MLNYPSMPDNGRDKLKERKMLRKKKDAEEVSQLPNVDPEDSYGALQKGRRHRKAREDTPPTRFWEVWSADAPRSDQVTPTRQRRADKVCSSVIMSSLHAPVVVELLDKDEADVKDEKEEITMKVIPPPPLPVSGSRNKVPLNKAEAEFPSRRKTSGDPKFRFAPRLIFPHDIEESNSCLDQVYMIGDDFELGDNLVTDVQPRRTSYEMTERKDRSSSRGSITMLRPGAKQDRRSSSSEVLDGKEHGRRTSSTTRLSLSSKVSDRRASESKEDTLKKPSPTHQGPSPPSELRLQMKRKKKAKTIVRIPPITQDQWSTIQQAYSKFNAPPPRICRETFHTRSPVHDKYPVPLPDAFQLLQEIQAVERLPVFTENSARFSSIQRKENSLAFISEVYLNESSDEKLDEAGKPRRSSKRSSLAHSQQGHRHSSVLYYVDPAIKRESLNVFDLPIQEEDNSPPEYEIVTTINEKTQQMVTYMERRKSSGGAH